MTTTTERHVATVTNVDDPEQRGRIRVTCVGLMGDDDGELPMFVEPALDWGVFVVPNVGEIVEIEVTSGSALDESAGQASIEQLNPRWRGARFYDVKADAPTTPVHPDFVENYGKRRGFATPIGHTLIFDDTAGSEKTRLTWRDKAGKIQFIEITDNAITMSIDGDASKHVPIVETLEAFYNSLKAKLDAFDAHVHPTGVGPSGPPAPLILAPVWDANINSTKISIPDG